MSYCEFKVPLFEGAYILTTNSSEISMMIQLGVYLFGLAALVFLWAFVTTTFKR